MGIVTKTVTAVKTDGGMGISDTNGMKASFPQSPMYQTESPYSNDAVSVLMWRIVRGKEEAAQGYWGFSMPFDPGFGTSSALAKAKPPAYEDVYYDTDDEGGGPSNAWVPNLTSGDPSNPSAQPAPSADMKDPSKYPGKRNNPPGIGEGSQLAPWQATWNFVHNAGWTWNAMGWSGATTTYPGSGGEGGQDEEDPNPTPTIL